MPGSNKRTSDPLFRLSEATADRSLIIVEDDVWFLQKLSRAMEARGFVVSGAQSVTDAIRLIVDNPPAFAVVDLRLGDENGLDVIAQLLRRRPTARAIVLTGFGSLVTTVLATKLGAINYLAKPADADDVTKALLVPNLKAEPRKNPMHPNRVKWEHIQRVYELCDRNKSLAARRLNMHRRTLQRRLDKRAPQA